MKPAPFKYAQPASLEEALELKARYGGDASFLAGGQSLIPAMNFRLARPEVLLDINTIADLDYARLDEDGALRIGALARHRRMQLDETVARAQPLVREAAPHVAHPQIRNRGTLCGNLAHADPASEMPAVMLALGARLKAQSVRGARWIAARDFFVSVFTTDLVEDEMLAEVVLPAMPPRSGSCFLEISRRAGDYAMMGVAALVTLDPEGACADARLTYCGAGETPIAADRAAETLIGGAIDEASVRAVGDLASDEMNPPGTAQASPAFQKHLAGVLTRRALAQAAVRARGEEAE
jgi:carbon-monoxide dehydrogenase medium subunit